MPSKENPHQLKQLRREELLALRAKAHLHGAEAAEKALTSYLLSFIEERGKLEPEAVIGAYWPINQEIGTESFLTTIFNRGCKTVLPVVEGEQSPLIFRHWTPDTKLVRGKFGVLIPPENNDILVPDVLVIPLVGFDLEGRRLGYGGGYYDRTLEFLRRKRDILALGVAFSCQQLEKLPTEPHDQKLDGVVTEKGPVELGGE